MRTILLITCLLICFFLSYFMPIDVAFSQSQKDCLRCHSVKTLSKNLEDKKTLSLYVDGSKFEKSVHGALECSYCHTEITMKNHPRPKKIDSKQSLSKQVSHNCLACHPKDALMKPKMHGELVKRGEPSCAECHGSHYISSIKRWKKTISCSEYCLTCHSLELSKTLPSKEKLSLKVNHEEIKKSVHGKFECINCHSDFSITVHPSYNYKDKAQYRKELTGICKKCHTDSELKKNPIHYELTKTASCIECHGAHNVKPAKVAKGATDNRYCLNCHSKALSMKMKNGETLSVQVKESDIMSSAHNKQKCIECHKEFSATQHPVRTFESISDYRAKAKYICNNCHQDAVKKYDISIHAMSLKNGNVKAPDCLKCHDYHKTTPIKQDKTAGLKLCSSCHSKEMEAFKSSVHHTALTQGKKDAPNCSSCHNAHDVLSTNVAKINNSCIKCHKNIKNAHNKWLWNPPFRLTTFVDTHFNFASCSSCHISVKKALSLTLVDKNKKEALTEEEIAKVLEVDVKEVKTKLDLNGDGKVQENELWKFMKALKKKINAELAGRIDVVEPNDAHKIVAKAQTIKDCATCHNTKTDFSGKLEINKEGTKPAKYELETKAFNSIYSIPNISDFYVLGTTKIKILDILFLIALLGGISVPIAHITLRILTAPIRRKRREGK